MREKEDKEKKSSITLTESSDNIREAYVELSLTKFEDFDISQDEKRIILLIA